MSDTHRQIHRPTTGDSRCICGGWEGPMTTLTETDPRSFEAHVAERESKAWPPRNIETKDGSANADR